MPFTVYKLLREGFSEYQNHGSQVNHQVQLWSMMISQQGAYGEQEGLVSHVQVSR